MSEPSNDAERLLARVRAVNEVFSTAERRCWQTQYKEICELVPLMTRFIAWGQTQGGFYPSHKKGYFCEHGESRFFSMSYSTFTYWERLAYHKELQEMAERGELTIRIMREPEWVTDDKKRQQGKPHGLVVMVCHVCSVCHVWSVWHGLSGMVCLSIMYGLSLMDGLDGMLCLSCMVCLCQCWRGSVASLIV